MTDLFRMQCSALPERARVIGFRGTEALCRPYVLEIFLQVSGPEAHDTDIGGAAGAKACLVVSRDDHRGPFVFAGRLEELSLLHEAEERAVLRAVLMPRLWQLSQSVHSRMFTRRSIPEIIETVLMDNGFSPTDYALRLGAPYKPEEHVCQYKESDLDFLSRWMEREGLYYFFEHAEEGERLVVTDHRSFHGELVPSAVRYFPQGGQDVTAGEHLESFVCRHRRLPASVRITDHDYTRPTLDVSGSAAVSASGAGEIHVHGARLFTPAAAKRLATLRAEELKARERVFSGSGTALHLRSGYRFRLTDHPRSAFDTTYLAVEVEHHGNQMAGAEDLQRLTGLEGGSTYRAQVTAIPAGVQFRAEPRTPWPRIHGAEHGTVDGEAESDYAQLDEHGRYLVRFAFDESDLGAGKASTRVRMMQPHGGSTEGWHFPLRKGTEVLLTFLGGDPDRPVIAGVVPNALAPSNVTNRNHTQNVLRTGGGNHIVMEDQDGAQFIDMVSPTAKTRQLLGKREFVGVTVPPSDPNRTPHEDLIEATYHVATSGNTVFSVGGAWYQGIGGDHFVDTAGSSTVHFAGASTFIVGKTSTEFYMGPRTTNINAPYTQNVWPAGEQNVRGNWKHNVTGEAADDYGNWETTVKKDWIAVFGGEVFMRADGTVTIKSPRVLIDAPDVTIRGEQIQMKSSWLKGITGPSVEFYTVKESVGAQKADTCTVSISVTGYSASLTSAKGEYGGARTETFGGAIRIIGSDVKTAGTAVANAAANVVSAAISVFK